jgi:multiple sugar transport system permease protein
MTQSAMQAQPVAHPTVARSRPPRLSLGLDRQTMLLYLTLFGLSILFCIPFLWLVLTSLKPPADVFDDRWIPRNVTLENYQDVFRLAPVERWLMNSFFISILGVITVVLSSSLVAYGFARLRFRGRRYLFGLVIATYMVPSAITMVPTFLIWNKLGLVGTFYPLWAGNLFGSAFYIFMLRQFFLSIPQDLSDAARIDGAGYFRIYWSIMMPLMKPALAAVAIFEFQAKWNDFLIPLIYLNKPSMYTMSLGLGTFRSEYETQWSLLMAASVIFTIPMIALFFLAQRYFVEGVVSSGLKT